MADIFVAPKHLPADNKPNLTAAHSPNHALRDSEEVKILSTFCKNPTEISFQTQKPDESILLFLRSHLIVNLSWIIIAASLVLLPLIAAISLPMLHINIFFSPAIIRFAIVYVLFYYSLVFSYVFANFLHWFYNVFMVTTKQVVDIDYSDIVIHHIAVTALSQVQDAKYTQSGFVPTFFNYGNIFVQTAGTLPNFQEPSIPKPREATHIIGDIIGKGLK
jgi:hypothetical protein